jgi:serine/threonine protein phosphatase PrpC
MPGDAFRIGTLEFDVKRFNVAVVQDIGGRNYQEDSHKYVQDLNISPAVSCTYFAVFDGHGGEQCS